MSKIDQAHLPAPGVAAPPAAEPASPHLAWSAALGLDDVHPLVRLPPLPVSPLPAAAWTKVQSGVH
eukprot:297753-Pelagomonas_calceolata.AAC.1